MTQKPSRVKSRDLRRADAARHARSLGPPSLPEWPPDRPRPTFATEAEEAAFLKSYSFAEYWEASKSFRVEPGTSALLRGKEDAKGSFAHLRVLNSGRYAPRVRCWVRFFRHDGSAVFDVEMPARWSSAPEPFTPCQETDAAGVRRVAWVFDPSKVELGYFADFAPREEHAAAVAVKFADGTCWGWPPDAYEHGGRHPRWRLPPEPLLVQTRVLANGRDYCSELTLDATATVRDFGVTSPGVPGNGGSTPAGDEVEGFQRRVARFKVFDGGLSGTDAS